MNYIGIISYLSCLFIYFSRTMIPSRLILLCLTTLWSFTSATVLMTQTSTWLGGDGLMKTHGFCAFNITKKLTKGKWKMTINTDITTKYIKVSLFVCLMVFNATFNNISVISWRSVLLMEETGGPGENHRPVVSH